MGCRRHSNRSVTQHFFQAPPPEHLRELLPQYGIEHYIDQGSIGAVYKGRQISLDRDVAIKVLFHEFGDNPELRESFLTEARSMARLKHPNLLAVFDFGDVDGMPYTVMEYVNGESLHDAAWNHVIDPVQAASIVVGICKGLACAHEQNIFHRDIKPSNILLTLDAEPKVADFSLTHAKKPGKAGSAKVNLGYTAPEVIEDPSLAGELSDIYSVGVILHQLITGLDPLGSTGPPTQPTGRLRLDAIWSKATHITPALRHPSASALAADLENWIAVQQAPKKATPAAASAPYNPTKPKIHAAPSAKPMQLAPSPLTPKKLSLHSPQQATLRPSAENAAAPYNPTKPKIQAAPSAKPMQPKPLAPSPLTPKKLSLHSPQQAPLRPTAKNAAAPYNPKLRKPLAVVQPTGNGGGLMLKLFVIGILVIVIAIAYMILQQGKEEIREGISSGGSVGGTPSPDRQN
jgi:serine/threonine protein kinase